MIHPSSQCAMNESHPTVSLPRGAHNFRPHGGIVSSCSYRPHTRSPAASCRLLLLLLLPSVAPSAAEAVASET